MYKFRTLLLLIALGLSWSTVALCAYPPSQASRIEDRRIDDRKDAIALPTTTQAVSMSLDQAVAMVQTKYGARAVRANTVEENGRVVHYIRLMSADRSRVWTVRVDAATGREI